VLGSRCRLTVVVVVGGTVVEDVVEVVLEVLEVLEVVVVLAVVARARRAEGPVQLTSAAATKPQRTIDMTARRIRIQTWPRVDRFGRHRFTADPPLAVRLVTCEPLLLATRVFFARSSVDVRAIGKLIGQRIRDRTVDLLERMRVVQRHCGVRMTQAMANGSNVVTSRDRERGCPVTQVVQPPRRVKTSDAPSASPPRFRISLGCRPGRRRWSPHLWVPKTRPDR
jgi:hypothetical protein